MTWKGLHKRPVDAVTRMDVVGVIDALPHKVAADRARTALSAFYSWTIEAGYAEANPTANGASRAKNGSRTRVLSEAELVEVWRACLADDYGAVVKLLVLSGQRRNEMADLAWSEIDEAKRQINLPADRVKNKRPHIVPLSAEAVAILEGHAARWP